MIVRIIGEGQYRLDDALIDDLNALDAELQIDLVSDDAAHFCEVLQRMAALIHERGEPLADAEFLRSDAVVPPPDALIEEIRQLLGDEGLIPG